MTFNLKFVRRNQTTHGGIENPSDIERLRPQFISASILLRIPLASSRRYFYGERGMQFHSDS